MNQGGASNYPNLEQPNYPPPGYSLPGQNPPVAMEPRDKSSYAQQQQPPPPGLIAGAGGGQRSPIGQRHQPPVVIYTHSTVNQIQFGPYPMRFTCPNCNAHVMTETHSTPGLLTWILSGALCVLAGYLLCCLVPCCVRECKDIEHKCPNCHHKLGLYKRI